MVQMGLSGWGAWGSALALVSVTSRPVRRVRDPAVAAGMGRDWAAACCQGCAKADPRWGPALADVQVRGGAGSSGAAVWGWS